MVIYVMPRIMKYSKNVTLEADVIRIIESFMNKTRKNFSATVNIIINQWFNFRKQIHEIEQQQIEEKTQQQLEAMQQAKVEKP